MAEKASARFVVAATIPSNDPHIHRAGCADVARGVTRRTYAAPVAMNGCETPEAAAIEWWGDIIAESEDEKAAEHDAATAWTRIFPCAREAS